MNNETKRLTLGDLGPDALAEWVENHSGRTIRLDKSFEHNEIEVNLRLVAMDDLLELIEEGIKRRAQIYQGAHASSDDKGNPIPLEERLVKVRAFVETLQSPQGLRGVRRKSSRPEWEQQAIGYAGAYVFETFPGTKRADLMADIRADWKAAVTAAGFARAKLNGMDIDDADTRVAIESAITDRIEKIESVAKADVERKKKLSASVNLDI